MTCCSSAQICSSLNTSIADSRLIIAVPPPSQVAPLGALLRPIQLPPEFLLDLAYRVVPAGPLALELEQCEQDYLPLSLFDFRVMSRYHPQPHNRSTSRRRSRP